MMTYDLKYVTSNVATQRIFSNLNPFCRDSCHGTIRLQFYLEADNKITNKKRKISFFFSGKILRITGTIDKTVPPPPSA